MTRAVANLVGLLLALGAFPSQKRTTAQWWTVQDRVVSGADSLSVHVIEIDLARSRMRVASVPFETGRKPGEAQLNINEFADHYRNGQATDRNG